MFVCMPSPLSWSGSMLRDRDRTRLEAHHTNVGPHHPLNNEPLGTAAKTNAVDTLPSEHPLAIPSPSPYSLSHKH